MQRGISVAIAGLAALAVAMGVGRFAFTPLLPMMQQDAGLSVADGGWLASANYLGYLAGALWAGAQRMDSAAAIRTGLAVIGVATLGMAFDAGFAAWAALRFVAGIASAWVLVHTSAWALGRIAPLGKPMLGGVLFAGVGAGVALAGMVCVLLMALRAVSSMAWLVLGLLSLLITAVLWPNLRSPKLQQKPSGEPARWTLDQARMVIAYGAYGFGYIIPATFLPVMAKEVVSDPAVFGWAWPAFGAAAALSTLAVVPLSQRYGNRAAWIGCHAVMAIGVAAPALWAGLGGIALAALCVGATFVTITMVGLQEARQVAGAQAPRLMAAMTAAFATGQIAGPLTVSLLVSAGGGFAAALWTACGALAAGAALLATSSSRR
jgi:predicted MFS family arabinose efflux permease